MLKETGEFVINPATKDLAYATDWCGGRSGRQYKFEEMHLTPGEASIVSASIIEESPLILNAK